MTRTFCDICGEELEQRHDYDSLTAGRPAIHMGEGLGDNVTTMAGESIVKEIRLNFSFHLQLKGLSADICRKCVLEAVRYIADNK